MRADAGGAGRERRIKTPAPSLDERRRIPEAERETPKIGASAWMSAARGKIVIPVEDRQSLGIHETADGECLQRELQKIGIPTVQQIPGDREMLWTTPGDAIELALQPGHVARVP